MRNDRHIADAGKKKKKNEITSLKEDAVNLILKDIRELGECVTDSHAHVRCSLAVGHGRSHRQRFFHLLKTERVCLACVWPPLCVVPPLFADDELS